MHRSGTVSELKKRLEEEQKQRSATNSDSAPKAFQQEIALARAKATVVNAQPAAVAATSDREKDAAERKERIARMNAQVAGLTKKPEAAKSAALVRDQAMFGDEHKARVQQNRAMIAKWSEQMHQQTRRGLVKMLNIGHLLNEAKPQMIDTVPVEPASKPVRVMQVMTVGSMYHNPMVNLIEEMEQAPEDSATMAEFFDFVHLRKAAVAKLPEQAEITEETMLAKLDAFVQIAMQFKDDEFLAFVASQQQYDELLKQLRTASNVENPRLRGAFRSFQEEFVKVNKLILDQMLDAVTYLSDLIAYLEKKADDVGINLHTILQLEYEEQHHSVRIQMKKILIERCSPAICEKLGINNDNEKSILDVIKRILTNEALLVNDHVRAAKML